MMHIHCVLQESGTVITLHNKRAAIKARIKKHRSHISVCAVIFLLLSTTCFALFPYKFGSYDYIHVHKTNGLPNLAIQNHGSIIFSKAIRPAWKLSQTVHAATVPSKKPSIPHFPGRSIDVYQERFPVPKLPGFTIKVRAPPLYFSSLVL